MILHITNIPTPYRLPYYRTVNRKLESAGSIFMSFCRDRENVREWKIGEDDLKGFADTLNNDGLAAAYGNIVDAIKRLRPEMVVLAWAMDPLALRVLILLPAAPDSLHALYRRDDRHGRRAKLCVGSGTFAQALLLAGRPTGS